MTDRRKEFRNLVSNLSSVPQNVITEQKKRVGQSPYRQQFHLESIMGQLNDPNGFSFFAGYYHLFYQSFPLKFTQNPTYFEQGWQHLKSRNLIDWQDLGQAMANDTKCDQYGVYSGSAIQTNNRLFLMYTGNSWIGTNTPHWHRMPTQLGAWMDRNDCVTKLKSPLIKGRIKGYTGHFRDPKIFQKKGIYYAVIGAQKTNQKGTVLLYKSQDLLTWKKIGEVKTNFDKNMGYMCECPDYFELAHHGILLFCPQGLNTKNNRFLNQYQACYSIGQPLNLNTGQFTGTEFNEIDQGFDFYAPQTMLTPDGRRILIAWMSILNGNDPTVDYDYTGCLTFPRELTCDGKYLYQKPIDEIKDLVIAQLIAEKTVRQEEKIAEGRNQRDLKLTIKCGSKSIFVLDLFSDDKNSKHLRLILNAIKNRFIVNRANAGASFEDEYGTERNCAIDLSKEIQLRILQDTSSAEIFLENGKHVFTMRVFTSIEQNKIFVTSLNEVTKIKYEINCLRAIKRTGN